MATVQVIHAGYRLVKDHVTMRCIHKDFLYNVPVPRYTYRVKITQTRCRHVNVPDGVNVNLAGNEVRFIIRF